MKKSASSPRCELTQLSVVYYDKNGAEESWKILVRSAELKADHPNQVHFLLANHDLAQVARTICSGLMGVELNSTLRWDNASETAFAMTTGGAIALPSPTPLTPNGFKGDGKWRCFSSRCGTSLAPGTR